MENYVAAGLDPARFWQITPAMAALELRGAARRIERERSLAWFAGMGSRIKDPPSHDEFVQPRKRHKAQTQAQIAANVRHLAKALGAKGA